MARKSAAALAEHQITIAVRGDELSRMGDDPAAYVLEAVRRRLAIRLGTITSAEFAERTRALGLPRTRFAELAGYNPGYVQRVAEGHAPVSPALLKALETCENDQRLGKDIIAERRRRRQGSGGPL